MTQTKSGKNGFLARHKSGMEISALVALLILPVLLYFVAQAKQDVMAGILLALTAGVMLVVIGLT